MDEQAVCPIPTGLSITESPIELVFQLQECSVIAPKLRPYQFYDTAVSLCSTCFRRVDAKIVFQDGGVWMLKRCQEHGAERVLIADDIDYYKRAREIFVKTPEQVAHYNTPVRWGCPYDCGVCPDHEQHGPQPGRRCQRPSRLGDHQ